ncbi:hypothetical protein AG1IA_08805 [Rhizoctonia solani AG-1 IA]|uniref:Uncharacterized protein n=1 Tax=Thanatephorus cucumeris (strain AG1-IA) TaxID=983506 RepID=L8WG52_THACA|nr:hypothetical protein AG1IA_08805 [Rhizoctonia solani AG-1 IA]
MMTNSRSNATTTLANNVPLENPVKLPSVRKNAPSRNWTPTPPPPTGGFQNAKSAAAEMPARGKSVMSVGNDWVRA